MNIEGNKVGVPRGLLFEFLFRNPAEKVGKKPSGCDRQKDRNDKEAKIPVVFG